MNKDKNNIIYNISSSEDFLKNTNEKYDLIYFDTCDMTPIEETAQLHLRKSKIIVERNLLNNSGLILIDDVMSFVPNEHWEESNLGKPKYSIDYFIKMFMKLWWMNINI